MAENINILGKGFEYEERTKIKRIQEVITGTITALVGGANWGPVGAPTLLFNDFSNTFGTPLTREDKADTSGLAADYALKYTPLCWYTRVSDGSEEIATYDIFKNAVAAQILGNKMLRDSKFIIYDAVDPDSGAVQNNKLSFTVALPGGNTSNVTTTLQATDGCPATESDQVFPAIATDSQGIQDSYNFGLGSIINFNIDDMSFKYNVRNEITDGLRNPDMPDFLNLMIPATGVYGSKYTEAAVAAYFSGTFALPDTDAVRSSFSGFITGMTLTAGFAEISKTAGNFLSGDVIGVANTTYNVTVVIDGVSHILSGNGTGAGTTLGAILVDLDDAIKLIDADASIAIASGKIKVTSGSVGANSSIAISPTAGDNAAFLTAIDASTTIVVTAGAATDKPDPILVNITANVPGGANGNLTIMGNGTSTIQQLLDATPVDFTVAGGLGAEILKNNTSITMAGGADVATHVSTAIIIKHKTAGVIGNSVVLTGDGIKSVNELLTSNLALVSGNGAQIVKSGTTISLSSGLASGMGIWTSYTPAATVDTYAKRFAYALKKYVVVPKLMAAPSSLAEGAAKTRADLLVTTDVAGTKVIINSLKKGSASSVIIYSMPKIFNTTLASISNRGTDTGIDSIISQINASINAVQANSAVASIDTESYLFTFSAFAGGVDSGVQINPTINSLYSALGIVATDMVYGTDAVTDAGAFIAAYPGKDGNTIQISKAKTSGGYVLTISFQGYSVASFFNYSYKVSDSNFIGKLMAADTRCNKIVRLEVPAGMTDMPELAYGTITLAGGTSGVAVISDSSYNFSLDEYKNLDLYNVDVLCVSGHTSQSIQDKIQEVCEYRRDCFAIIDAPEDVAGTAKNGGSIYRMIDWHNGVGDTGRTKKLTSKFVSTYFPWISIPDGTVNAESNWYAPSVRVLGAIANCDKINYHKFSAPAGSLNTPLNNINALAQYTREDEKAKMYADELNNNINPLVYTTSRGFFIDGQKNCERGGAAISRLNVLRTSLYIKKRIYEMTPNYFWKPLNKRTQDEFAEELKKIGDYLSSSEINAIKGDFNVVCDATVNTETIEAKRGLIGVFEWTPVRSIEKIKVISIIRDLAVDVTFA